MLLSAGELGRHAARRPIFITLGCLLSFGLTGAGGFQLRAEEPAAAGGDSGFPAGVCEKRAAARVRPEAEALRARGPPAWWQDAKLGIFIHWGLYSVPAYASKKYSFSQYKSIPRGEYEKNNPYAEWYLLTSLVNDSATAHVHRERYGEEPSMDSYLSHFVPAFNREIKHWNPKKWASLFRKAGAEYVVLTTKHHDSFLLWPSAVTNPHRRKEHQHASRDLVGELTRAVRGQGMEMGVYYSGGLDWSFKTCKCPPLNMTDYEDLAYSHLQELIRRYRPSILWDDINWPGLGEHKRQRLYGLFADYLNNNCPQGTMNDRWAVGGGYSGDFGTPEYENQDKVSPKPFEMCRGIGQSFGLNAEERAEDHMSPSEAVWLLADVVAKNGNLLLDVGPAANGSLPWPQERVLRGLAAWMELNGQAIKGARPYLGAGEAVSGGVRYTARGDYIYAVVQKAKFGSSVLLDRPELMVAAERAQLLVSPEHNGLLQLSLLNGGWHLPEAAAELVAHGEGGALPIVLRFEVHGAMA